MSDPIALLKKNKKPPLYLPEMSTPTPMPTISAYNTYTPRSDLGSDKDVASSQPLSCFNAGYVRSSVNNKKISSYLPLSSTPGQLSSHRSSLNR